jgi:hypothetical protein
MENTIIMSGNYIYDKCKIKKIIEESINDMIISNDLWLWKTICQIEEQLAHEIKNDKNLNSNSKKKYLNQLYYDLLLYLESIPNLKIKINKNFKITNFFLLKTSVTHFANKNTTFDNLWYTISEKLKTHSKIPAIPKILIRNTKKFYKSLHLQKKDQQESENILNILESYLSNQYIDISEVGLSKEILGTLSEIIIFSNYDLIKNFCLQFKSSYFYQLFTIQGKEKIIESIIDDQSTKDVSLDIEKSITNLKCFLSIIENVKIENIIVFLVLYINNFLTFQSDDKLISFLDPTLNMSPIISSLGRQVLINTISTLDKAFDENIFKISNFSVRYIYNYEKFRHGSEKKKEEIKIETIHSLIKQVKNEKFLDLYKKQLEGIDINSQKSNVKEITKGIANLMGSFFSKKVDSNLEKTQQTSNNNSELYLNSLKLYPYNPNTPHLPHVYIFISGFISELDEDNIEWSKFIDCISESSDCYLYKWESENKYKMGVEVMQTCLGLYSDYKQKQGKVIENIDKYRTNNLFLKTKKNSKFYGKLLAYIISCQNFFENKCISLVGFSLGCNVLKYCIKEMYKIYSITQDSSLLDIIHNIIFIAGATTFKNTVNWTKNFNLAKGKLINCYSSHDKILKYLYNTSTEKTAIGLNPLEFSKNLFNFYNLDFSHLEMGHSEYRHFLHIIYNRLKNEFNII